MLETCYNIFFDIIQGFNAFWEFLNSPISEFSFDLGDGFFQGILESVIDFLVKCITTIITAIGSPDATWLDFLFGYGVPVLVTMTIIRWVRSFI